MGQEMRARGADLAALGSEIWGEWDMAPGGEGCQTWH